MMLPSSSSSCTLVDDSDPVTEEALPTNRNGYSSILNVEIPIVRYDKILNKEIPLVFDDDNNLAESAQSIEQQPHENVRENQQQQQQQSASENNNNSSSSLVQRLIEDARALNERLKSKNNQLWTVYGHARNVLTRYRLMRELEQCHNDLSFNALRHQNPASRSQLIARLKAEQSTLHAIRQENVSLKQMLNEYQHVYYKIANAIMRHDTLLRTLPQQERYAVERYYAMLAERVAREQGRRQVLEHYAFKTVATFEQTCRERIEVFNETEQLNRWLASKLDITDCLERLDYLNGPPAHSSTNNNLPFESRSNE